jgi:tetratricopeptide (TPR) repeat protein
MNRILTLFLILIISVINSTSADEVEELLNKALNAKNKEVGSDSSASLRYLNEILERDPENLEALWQLALINLNSLANTTLSNKAPYLAALGPNINKILKIADKKDDKAFYHYVNAAYAKEHNNFERATSEIEKSVKLDPTSPRYLVNKGQILIYKGRWMDDDQDIEEGIKIINDAIELSKKNKNPFHSPWHNNFVKALGYSFLDEPKWQEVLSNYQTAIDIMKNEGATESKDYAFAWNNISNAYRKLGECEKSKNAAEEALKVMKFGAAKNNKTLAEFCLEMREAVSDQKNKDNPG